MEKMQFQTGNLENRKKHRLLSSLLDLKLQSTSERKDPNEEEGLSMENQGKRKGQKYCPIKMSATETHIY